MKAAAFSPTSLELTQRLIVCEGGDVDAKVSATFRVCDRLRPPLSALLGTLGYRTLILRALTLAKRKSSALSRLSVKQDGALGGLDNEAMTSGHLLVEPLVGLLLSFFGEAVTLQLLHDVWPALPGLNTTTEEAE